MSDESIPGIRGVVAAQMFEKLTSFIPPQHLSFGGGTVLAARWNHRVSVDVDLFCEPTTYGRLTPVQRAGIEKAIKEIAGCAPSQTWCEDIATYTEIRGIEATVLPGIIVIEPSKPTTLDGTRLTLQSSAQILYGKIAWRMYEGGEIAVRDTLRPGLRTHARPTSTRASALAREPASARGGVGNHQAAARGVVGRLRQGADPTPLRVVRSRTAERGAGGASPVKQAGEANDETTTGG